MADDRHNAYRTTYTISALNDLFKRFSKKRTVGDIAYALLSIQAAYPNDNIETIIELTKNELYGE